MVHEQVQKQLDFLKMLVDAEENNQNYCRAWGIPYRPSRTTYEDIHNYTLYKNEIEKNGDKNLLKMVDWNGKILPFARRYAYVSFGDYFLIHRCDNGTEYLMKESEAKTMKVRFFIDGGKNNDKN